VGWENETLRFPTNLDHDTIVKRLVNIRAMAVEKGPPELASLLDGVETMPPPKLGVAVISAISLLADKPEHGALASRLEIIAVNLKNIK
jgi:hypothetical protein